MHGERNRYTEGTTPAKKVVLLLLKVAVSSALVALVLRAAGPQNILAHLRAMDLRFFLLASALHLGILGLAALRWGILLGGRHRYRRLLSLCLIGSFFNNLLPGAVGGDALKMYYLYQDTREGGRSIASVFMDRYMGYLALLTIGLAAGIIAFRELAVIGMQWVTPLMFLAFLAVSAVVFGMQVGRRFSSVADFYEFFHTTLRDRAVLAKTYGISLAIQTLSVLSVACVALGVGAMPSLASLFVFVPVIISVMAVPVSISGLGLRESAFVLLFGLAGIPTEAAAAIGFLWFLSIALSSLIGLVEHLRFRRR